MFDSDEQGTVVACASSVSKICTHIFKCNLCVCVCVGDGNIVSFQSFPKYENLTLEYIPFRFTSFTVRVFAEHDMLSAMQSQFP